MFFFFFHSYVSWQVEDTFLCSICNAFSTIYHCLRVGSSKVNRFFAQSTGISYLLGYWIQSRKLISRRDNVRDGSLLMQFKNKITDSNLGKVMAKNNDQRLSPGLLKMIKTRMTVNCSNILEISIWLY